MKNTIIFNLNDFNCDCISMVNDGTNSITIEARKNNFTAPHIVFTLSDGTTAETDELQHTGGIISYTIPAEYYAVDGSLALQVTDGAYSSPEINITGKENASGASLTIKEETDTQFICIVSTPAPSGGEFTEEWQAIINANTAARHSHGNKVALDAIETALTNMEIEALLTD